MDRIEGCAVNSVRWLSLEDFEDEIWRDIAGFDGAYAISNYGRIKSFERTIPCKGKNNSDSYVVVHEKILHLGDNGHGYLIANLSSSNKTNIFYVHRLVATAFIPNPQQLPTVNHKDENKSNNKVSNLEWASYQYNNNYGTAKQRSRQTIIKSGYATPIDMYDLQGNFIKHYDCSYDMEKDGISRRAALNVCSGRNRSYHGFVFVFAGEEFRYREANHHIKGQKRKVIKKDHDGNVVFVYDSIKAAERDNGLNRNHLYSATYAASRQALINGFYFQIINQ